MCVCVCACVRARVWEGLWGPEGWVRHCWPLWASLCTSSAKSLPRISPRMAPPPHHPILKIYGFFLELKAGNTQKLVSHQHCHVPAAPRRPLGSPVSAPSVLGPGACTPGTWHPTWRDVLVTCMGRAQGWWRGWCQRDQSLPKGERCPGDGDISGLCSMRGHSPWGSWEGVLGRGL